MLKFFVRAFAVIGFIVTLLIVLGAFIVVHEQDKAPEEPDNVILTLDFDQPIVEQPESSPLDLALHEDTTPLLDILHAIDTAKADPHVRGIIARFGPTQPGLAQAQEIRAAIARFRTSGKFTYAFASSYGSFGLGSRSYYLASAFENIWLQPVGSVGLSGVAVEEPFLKDALDKIGVHADFMQREEYKSFMEMAQRTGNSLPVRTMMQGMIDDIAAQVAGGIAESRKWDVERVKRLMERGPFTDTEALEAGLVTQVGYGDELEKEANAKAGEGVKQADIETYLSYGSGGGKIKLGADAQPAMKIALIYGSGLIVDRSIGAGGLAGEKIMGADKIAGAFDDATDDDSVKAVLFRVDSPGGSPEASETIRRSLMRAQAKGKPVVVSMGEVAASGGYWVSMNANTIVANPGTLTGSIGVLAGKFVVGGLAQKLGVTFDPLKTSENAGMWSMVNDFTPAQRERVNALLDQTYHAFVTDVATARHIPLDKMPDVAKGRVWTGEQGVKMGLVDVLGGYDVALASIRKALKVNDTQMLSLEVFPPPETSVEKVMKLLKGIGVEGAMIRSALVQWQGLQTALGPVWNESVNARPVNVLVPQRLLKVVQ